MKRKFTLTEETLVLHENLTLYRIKALVDFGNIKAGTKGGFVQSWENLSHDGLCWIADRACVYGYARITGNALICDEAIVRRYARVYGNAVVRDNAVLKGSVHVYENALVGLRSLLIDGATVNGNARVLCEQFKGSKRRPNIRGYGTVTDNAQLLEHGFVRDNAILRGNVILRGNAGLSGRAVADENVILDGSAKMTDETRAFGHVFLTGRTKMFGRSAAYGRCTLTGKTLILCNAHVTGVGELQAICPDVPVGVYSAGLGSRDTTEPVIVAGIQSVYQKADVLGHFDLIIVDEAHLIPPARTSRSGNDQRQTGAGFGNGAEAPSASPATDPPDGEGMYQTFLRSAKAVNPNVRLIGLTATPYRLKSGMLCGPNNLLNEICYEIGVKELIVRGYLCPLKSRGSELAVDTSDLHLRGGEFVPAEVEALMGADEFEKAACKEIVSRTKDRNSVLVFAASVERAEAIQRLLTTLSGEQAAVVTGETSSGKVPVFAFANPNGSVRNMTVGLAKSSRIGGTNGRALRRRIRHRTSLKSPNRAVFSRVSKLSSEKLPVKNTTASSSTSLPTSMLLDRSRLPAAWSAPAQRRTGFAATVFITPAGIAAIVGKTASTNGRRPVTITPKSMMFLFDFRRTHDFHHTSHR